jgi:arylsulfatase A-like enzyme
VRGKPLFWKTSSSGSEAYIREGPWKVYYAVRKAHGDHQLYNIPEDPAEAHDLAAEHPDIVNKLAAEAEAWVATLPKEYEKTKDRDD